MDNFDERTPEEICLLCKRNNENHVAYANATNSHFTPMGMIQSNTGRRNYEATISINLTNGESHDVYYGRSNPQDTNPEIGDDPHTADYIFCQECEDNLAEIEGEMIDVLNRKLRHPNQSQNFPITTISEGVTFRECSRVDPLKFKLFIYSIIWRQNLQQQLAFSGQGILAESTSNKLREAIVSGFYDGTDENQLLHDCFPFSVITAYGFENATKHNISPHPLKNYPEVFCINEYIVLLYDQNENEDEEDLINRNFCELPDEVFNEELDNDDSEPIRIAFISDDAFENFQNLTHKESAKIKLDAIAKEEFVYALNIRIPGIEINPKHLFLDSQITEEQKVIVGTLVNSIANWNTIENRSMTRFKILQYQLPNRRGIIVPTQMGIIEIRNIDGNLYHRLGFYGNVD